MMIRIISCALLLGAIVPSALALQVNVVDTGNMTSSQINKTKMVVSYLNQVLNTPQFREAVINHQYNGQPAFADNDGLSNEQIYEKIMAGAEQFPSSTAPNNQADVKLTIYSPPLWGAFSQAVAFTSPSDPYLHFYKRYFKKSSVQDLGNTLIHEWTHKLGFGHDYNATAKRPYSVPYAIGDIVWDLLDQVVP
jgi:hypothetical protein